MTPEWPGIVVRDAGFGANVGLADVPSDGFNLLHGRGNGQVVAVGEDTISVVLALGSPVSLALHALRWPLRSRWMQVWRGPALRLEALDTGHWFVLSASVDAWDRLCRQVSGHRHRDATLFTDRGPAPNPVARAMIRLARNGAGNHGGAHHALLRCLCTGLMKHQAGLAAKLALVPGRSAAARHAAMETLTSTRELIGAAAYRGCNVSDVRLPAAASGPAFKRLYRRAFGETIPQHLNRMRAQAAYDLVCHSNMAMQEIASEVGFSSASAFTRFFANAYGMSPREARCTARARGVAPTRESVTRT